VLSWPKPTPNYEIPEEKHCERPLLKEIQQKEKAHPEDKTDWED